ncbi:MAG: hypothetical protein K8F91_12415 [Candidatus Obscuribacterales bacterium]|nr:hypothetical protein [Candidatus Obscuribacterales bacterium]
MFKVLFASIALSVFMWSIYSFVLSAQWSANAGPNWKVVDGWLVDIGGEYSLGMPGKLGRPFNLVITDQHVSYVYFVDDKLYFKNVELPANVFPVRVAIKELLPDFSKDIYDIPNAHLAPAMYDPEKNRLNVVTDPGMVVTMNGLTSRSMVQYKEVGKEEYDNYLYRIKVRYNTANPEESITEPDLLDGASVLQKSGILLLVISVLMGLGLKLHLSVSKEEEIPDPFAGTGGQTYR